MNNGPHSPPIPKKKILLTTVLGSFYEDSDIHQCFLTWDLLFGETTQRCEQFCDLRTRHRSDVSLGPFSKTNLRKDIDE